MGNDTFLERPRGIFLFSGFLQPFGFISHLIDFPPMMHALHSCTSLVQSILDWGVFLSFTTGTGWVCWLT